MELHLDALVRIEEELLRSTVGPPTQRWTFKSGQERKTASAEAFHHALAMPEAAEALATIRYFLHHSGVVTSPHWSISALPTTNYSIGYPRFCTASLSGYEVFFLELTTKQTQEGQVRGWGIRFDADGPGKELGRLSTSDRFIFGTSLDGLQGLLADPDIQQELRRVIDARATSRREDWHNPLLGDYLTAAVNKENKEERAEAHDSLQLERRYAPQLVKSRLHQARLRELALQVHGARCFYCGLDEPRVLDAAHLIADSAGGDASADNVRPLCANHHRAFDAGFLRWNGNAFERPDGVPVIPPLP